MSYNATFSNAALWEQATVDDTSGLIRINPHTVNVNSRFQYRHHLVQQYIDEKAAEFKRFKAQGQIPPTMILVCKAEGGSYEHTWDIVYGAYRCLGAQHANTEIWALDGTDMGELALHRAAVAENLLRHDPNDLEMTEGILRLISIETGLDQEGIARLLAWDHNGRRGNGINVDPTKLDQLIGVLQSLPRPIAPRTFYKKYLPLLTLPPALDSAMRQGQLDYTKALELKRLPPSALTTVLDRVLQEDLPVSEIKAVVGAVLNPNPRPVSPYRPISKQLNKLNPDTLGTEKRKQLEVHLEAIRKLLEDT